MLGPDQPHLPFLLWLGVSSDLEQLAGSRAKLGSRPGKLGSVTRLDKSNCTA